MKKRLFQIICVLMLLALGTVAVSADEAETENGEHKYSYSYNEAVSFGIDQEGQTVIYSTIIGGEIQGGEFATYVMGGENFVAGEYFTFVINNGENMQGMILQTESEKDDMMTVNCSSMIAPAVSVTLVSGTLVAAWVLKKRKNDE